MKPVLHIAFVLLTAIQAAAQQPATRHFTEDDGLPDNEIYYLYQDRKGIIWISTNGGLCRYNGNSFQHFSNPGLSAKSTGCIAEDVYGRIWVSNFSGQLFYVAHDSLVIVQLPGMPNISSTAPFAIGPQNQLAVTSPQGELTVYRAAHNTAAAAPDYVPDTVLKQVAGNPFFDRKGILWATVSAEPYLQQGVAASYADKQLRFYQSAAAGKDMRTDGFVFERNRQLYFFERQKNRLLHLEEGRFLETGTLQLPGLVMIKALHDNRLAFCTNDGLFISGIQERRITIETSLLTGQTISAICEDSNGNLWAGTLNGGLYFIPRQGMRSVTPDRPGPGLSGITALCKGPEGQLLAGFANGELGVLDQQFHYSTLQPANALSTKVQSIFYDPVMQLLNWNTGGIYMSLYRAGDKKIAPYLGIGYASKDMVFIPEWKAALVANPGDIQLISVDRQPVTQKVPAGWARLYDTVSIFDNNMPWRQQSILLSKERGRAVYYDSAARTCWGADKNGITLYRENGSSRILWRNEPIYGTSFCFHREMMWAGTFSQGLMMIRNGRAEKQFTVAEGLASNTIYKVIGSNGHLWIVTDKGVQYFDIEQERFMLVDKSMGLPSYKIGEAVLTGGRLFIATPRGLMYIPDSIRFEQAAPPPPYLNAVFCNGRITGTAKTRFATNENTFLFRIETPVYTNRSMLRYKYRLQGADRDFQTASLDKAVFEYNSLQPGSYTFELLLTDVQGRPQGPPVIFSFYIQPPFYKTTWFGAVCALALAALVYWLVKRRIGQIRRKNAEQLRLAQMETELKQSQLSGIKAQMNPHFMFNALNSIQEFILLNDKKQANLYMGKFADLMRMTLDMTSKHTVLLEDEIRMLQLYLELEALRFEQQFTYSITVDESIDTAHIELPAMLIQPHIENAVKHGLLHKGGEKILELHFFMKDAHTLCATITDNGIGRKRSGEINAQRLKKHTSFATGATHKRLELLNFNRREQIAMHYEDMADSHGNAAGTRVVLYIPV